MIIEEESILPIAMRTDIHQQLLLHQRQDLHSVYTDIENTTVTIEHIVRIQNACNPELPVTLNHADNPMFCLEELTNFLKQAKIDPSTKLEMIWRKTAH